jgi:cytochrome bd-type quinol oxidase subunit 2
MLYLGGIALLTIGIIVALSIKYNQSDKVKGDKRLVAAVFILTSVTCFLSGFIVSRCTEGISSTIKDATGIDNFLFVKAPSVKDNPFLENVASENPF